MHTSFFKSLATSLFIFSFLLVLCGCPYSSPYKIDTAPSVLIEDAFIGKWATMVVNGAGRELPLKMIVGKKNDYEYNISFTGNINDLRYFNVVKEDTLKCTSFISEAASRRFLNIEAGSQFYIAEFIYKNDKITLLPLCEHFTVKIVKSDAELKEALELHFRTRLFPLYDDEFSLREMSKVN